MAKAFFTSDYNGNSYYNGGRYTRNSIKLTGINGTITKISIYIGATDDGNVPSGSPYSLTISKNGTAITHPTGAYGAKVSTGGTPREVNSSSMIGVTLTSSDVLTITLNTQNSHANSCLIFSQTGSESDSALISNIEYNSSGSGGGGGSTPGLSTASGTVNFANTNETIDSGTEIAVTVSDVTSSSNMHYIELKRIDGNGNEVEVDYYPNLFSQIINSTTFPGPITLTDTPKYTSNNTNNKASFTYRVVADLGSNNEVEIGSRKSYLVKAAPFTQLGEFDAPTFSNSNYIITSTDDSKTNFLKLNDSNKAEYVINWTAPDTGGNNSVADYDIFVNNVQIDSNNSTNLSFSVLEKEYNLKDKLSHYIKAEATYNSVSNSSQSGTSYLYTLSVISPSSISVLDNETFTSGSATITWEEPEVIVHDEVNNFSFTYDVLYRTSSDKKNWAGKNNEEWTKLTSESLSSPSYVIPNVAEIVSVDNFIQFKISCNINYNGAGLTSVDTKVVENDDSFIVFAGNKPESFDSIEFSQINKKNETLTSIGSKEIEGFWSIFNCKYLTKETTLKVNFNANKLSYNEQGVKISWEKNGKYGSAIFTTTLAENSLTVPFSDSQFDENFWDASKSFKLSISSIVKKIVVAAADGIEEESFIVTEAGNATYSGRDIQVAKLPKMLTSFDGVGPINRLIPVNFEEGNQQPIVDKQNQIYEDLRIIGIKSEHPQDIKIYGYKAYASVYLNETWKDYQLITDKVFSASEGELNNNEAGLFTPIFEETYAGETIKINNVVSLELDILNKNNHLNNLLAPNTINNYFEMLKINYRIHVVDEFGQESINYLEYEFDYDCRKPATFEIAPRIVSPIIEDSQLVSINPYNENDPILTIPVFNKDKLIIKFYPAINPRYYKTNTDEFITASDGMTYLKSSGADSNIYYLYKFVRNKDGKIELSKNNENSKNPELLIPYSANVTTLKEEKEVIDNVEVSYYLYQLNLNLNNNNIDEIEYFQIVPAYIEDNIERVSRINYDENNLNGFNICNGNNSAVFWNSRISNPKIQVTGIERIAVTKDNFGFELPKMKLYITDWGTTHQFFNNEKISANDLANNFNRLIDLTYSINYYREKVNSDGSITKEVLNDNNGNPITLTRNYLTNSEKIIDYNKLALEYKDYYNNFEAMKEALEGSYSIEYANVNGETKLPIPATGSTLYINLPSPIKGTEEGDSNFYADVTIIGKIKRAIVNSDNNGIFIDEEISLSNYEIYISQNKKTFMIQQGKLGINQPELKDVEETLYLVDKKRISTTGNNYPNILGIEADRVFNKINDISGAFIGFYDDSIANKGERVSMGSIGLGMTFKENSEEVLSYEPYVFYNANANGDITALKLKAEGGAGIKVEGDFNNIISHTNSVDADSAGTFKNLTYDSQGHITGQTEIASGDIRKAMRIAYGVEPTENPDPTNENWTFVYPLGEPREGDIYLWIQNETQSE